MKVGFIGVGSIGNPMAGQLLRAGHELLVHDIRREAAASLLARGATWADSPAAVAAASEIVATCLPGPREMEHVTLGPKGILDGVRKGALYIDHTTNSPLLVRRVHDALAARNVDMLDAPVGNMMSLKVRLPATYLRGNFDPRFALKLARKDLGLALELARAYDTPMRLGALCEQEMVEAMARGWAERDASIFLTLQEERAKVQVRVTPENR